MYNDENKSNFIKTLHNPLKIGIRPWFSQKHNGNKSLAHSMESGLHKALSPTKPPKTLSAIYKSSPEVLPRLSANNIGVYPVPFEDSHPDM